MVDSVMAFFLTEEDLVKKDKNNTRTRPALKDI